MQVKFRRNTHRSAQMGKRGLMLILAIVLVSGLIYTFSKQVQPFAAAQPSKYMLPVRFLPQQRYLVHTDTTDYAHFASTLLRNAAAFQSKPQQLQIVFFIPPHLDMGELQDLYQIAAATPFETVLKKVDY